MAFFRKRLVERFGDTLAAICGGFSSDPWSLETSPSSLLILGSAILTDPVGEIRIVFLVAS